MNASYAAIDLDFGLHVDVLKQGVIYAALEVRVRLGIATRRFLMTLLILFCAGLGYVSFSHGPIT